MNPPTDFSSLTSASERTENQRGVDAIAATLTGKGGLPNSDTDSKIEFQNKK
jgi:hypothetical protein